MYHALKVIMRLATDLFPQIDEISSRQQRNFPEIECVEFWHLYHACKKFSLLHIPGFFNLYQSMIYLGRAKMSGCAAECGCLFGGASAFIGLMRRRLSLDLDIHVFDTFEGPPVGSTDVFVGGSPIDTPSKLPYYLENVKSNIRELVGDIEGFHFVPGLVEDTLPGNTLNNLALLRLDTDFYSSTKIELEILYPRLQSGGVLIVDDYGTFQGARKALDEYMLGLDSPPLLNRIDIGIVSGVKPPAPQSPWWKSLLKVRSEKTGSANTAPILGYPSEGRHAAKSVSQVTALG